MATSDKLSPNQNKALCHLVAGRSIDEVAELTGVSSRTINRWKANPLFRKILNQALQSTFDAAIAELVANSVFAAQELNAIIRNPDVPSRTRVSAIDLLLKNASRVKEMNLRYGTWMEVEDNWK